MSRPPYPATSADYQALARARLPAFLCDYVDGGASDEQTLQANTRDWQDVHLRQRVLVDVERIDTRTTLAGQPCALPLALAPVGLAGLMARRGEVQAARAAEALQVPFSLSTVGICPVDEVHAATTTPCWFQLYMLRDRGVVRAMLEKAWASGCRTLLFTVDLPLPGMRHRDTRHGLDAGGPGPALSRAWQVLGHPGWLWQVALRGRPLTFGSLSAQVPHARNIDAFKAWVDSQFDPGVTWADIEWLRGLWPGMLILKGILNADDARQAVRVGAQALVVSNHGGRQLDGVLSTARKLPEIAQAVGADIEVLVDGGVRSGTDLFRAVALGARGALIGRPWVWALAGAGEAGVRALIASWQRELLLAMTLAGVTRIADIDASHLDRVAPRATP
ncbi:FMN-dependent alpha-hydroxy acid dehydrogenase [Pseudomonas sp. ATCC 13867]|uniref:L-lactate dehydrogenase n=1 Tax=Pseudomonas sp. ATCC 13867 TaxID=1294143 RepID=UPI0002C4DB68|nr:L-lactate dehydrogenase [Pseudomonas sp. ATCC 13867]AGI24079.1 FMN-dependent alpha-hydroxy acid dehydrogenase [Pseudomonas sp. ATCC 13867]